MNNIINQILFNSRSLKYRLLKPKHDKSIWFHIELTKCINNKYKKVLKIIADNENCDENFHNATNNEEYRNFLLNNVEVIKTNTLDNININEYDAIGIYDAEQYYNLHQFISNCIDANIYVFFTAVEDTNSSKNLAHTFTKLRSYDYKKDYRRIKNKPNESTKNINYSDATFNLIEELCGYEIYDWVPFIVIILLLFVLFKNIL
jgi:hypothetical protein